MRKLCFALAALIVVSCRTPYMAYDCEPTGNPWPLSGWRCKGGYSELEIGADTYQVSFSGREISSAKSQEWALLRAAELTLEKGRRHFLVLNAWGQTDVKLHASPGSSTTSHVGDGVFATTSVGGGTSSTQLPQASYVIRFVDDAEADRADLVVYDAVKIARAIRSKYRLPAASAGVAARE